MPMRLSLYRMLGAVVRYIPLRVSIRRLPYVKPLCLEISAFRLRTDQNLSDAHRLCIGRSGRTNIGWLRD